MGGGWGAGKACYECQWSKLIQYILKEEEEEEAERISFWLEGISYSPSLHNNTTHIPGLHIVNLSHGLPRQPLRLKLANPPSILTFGWLLSANNSVRGKKEKT